MNLAINEFKVLLIDDDEDEYVFLKDILSEVKNSKFHIVWKSSYEEGLSALKNEVFDVCLLDYRLGALTGIDLLKDALKLNISCPIILLTGHGDFELDLQAMQIGAAEYLVKGQLTAPLLERSIRYTIKHSLDMEDLREQKEKLKKLLDERTEMEAQILLQDRMASIGLLASSLAHEIGTPMGIIRSRAEIAIKKTDNQTVKQDMDTIITQIDKISKLVNSLLNLARSKPSDHATSVSTDQVISDVINLVKHELDRKGIELEIHSPKGITVKSEAGPLGQVLLNLLVNAVHAIEEGREKNKSKSAHDRITLRAYEINTQVHIVVQDSGCGIAEQNLTHLFKPFFTTKDIGHGTGLGLATSYKLVQSWGGSMQVKSKLNEGTSFTVVLQKY